MKLNNKGFAISSLMYLILVMALILVAILLGLLNNRKMILDRQKKSITDSIYMEEIEPLTELDLTQSPIVIPITGLYKVELCGAYANSTKGSCTSGFITFQSKQQLYVNVGNSSSSFTDLRLVQNNQYSAIMFAAGGNNQYFNNSCSGSFISGHIGCISVNSSGTNTSTPVYDPDFIFSNTEIKTNQNSGTGSAKITFISSPKSNQTEFAYDYTGGEQKFFVPYTGYYKLEAWGAQGGEGKCNEANCSPRALGGYGGYSVGYVYLTKGSQLYVNVGGQGADATIEGCTTVNSKKVCTGKDSLGGYNGGGLGTWDGGDDEAAGGGGGATHISTVSGELYTLSSKQSKILIVSGGGGGGSWKKQGGSGGGIEGGAPGSGSKATQNSGYSFGKGQDATSIGQNNGHGGGGGGFYGGYESSQAHDDKDFGGGGSGYIGNSLLLGTTSTKYMKCYSCTTSQDASTYTLSVETASQTAVTDTPKIGNGYAKITYIGSNID